MKIRVYGCQPTTQHEDEVEIEDDEGERNGVSSKEQTKTLFRSCSGSFSREQVDLLVCSNQNRDQGGFN